jgi:hypothetical protein
MASCNPGQGIFWSPIWATASVVQTMTVTVTMSHGSQAVSAADTPAVVRCASGISRTL